MLEVEPLKKKKETFYTCCIKDHANQKKIHQSRKDIKHYI